jgi:hypothetical protein
MIESMTRPPSASDRQRLRTTANMWRALIPLVVLVGIAVFIGWPRTGTSDGVHVIDISGPIAAARQQEGFPILAPTGLSSGWRATSTDLTAAGPTAPAGFRIGFVSPKGRYAELFESNGAPQAVESLYGPLTSNYPLTVNGVQWQGFLTSSNRQLIEHTTGSVTVIVTGSADNNELIALAGSLR